MLQAQIFFDKDEIIGVIRAISGFGPNQLLKRPDALFSFDEVPMIVTFIDEKEKVKHVLTKLKPLVKNCLIVTTEVQKW
jgi:PII-like signaling protein